MKHLKSLIAIALSSLTLLHSCAVYQGNYSLQKAVDNGKKVKVKTQYNKIILYEGERYYYNRKDNHHAWSVGLTTHSKFQPFLPSQEESSILAPTIILSEGIFYGVKDYEDRDSWIPIDRNDIVEISKTERNQYQKLVFQEDQYWGVSNEDNSMRLVPIHENQVKKVSQYDPFLSVMGSILVTPLVVVAVLLTPVEDDW